MESTAVTSVVPHGTEQPFLWLLKIVQRVASFLPANVVHWSMSFVQKAFGPWLGHHATHDTALAVCGPHLVAHKLLPNRAAAAKKATAASNKAVVAAVKRHLHAMVSKEVKRQAVEAQKHSRKPSKTCRGKLQGGKRCSNNHHVVANHAINQPRHH